MRSFRWRRNAILRLMDAATQLERYGGWSPDLRDQDRLELLNADNKSFEAAVVHLLRAGYSPRPVEAPRQKRSARQIISAWIVERSLLANYDALRRARRGFEKNLGEQIDDADLWIAMEAARLGTSGEKLRRALRARVQRLSADGKFPGPLFLDGRGKCWLSDDINELREKICKHLSTRQSFHNRQLGPRQLLVEHDDAPETASRVLTRHDEQMQRIVERLRRQNHRV
jgi:hypothetical protein